MTTAFGLHRVTAIVRDAQQNVDFYAGVLGLRLVKKTVNFDDPKSYHLYFGDESGAPGSILTASPWPRARQGRAGVGEVALTLWEHSLESTEQSLVDGLGHRKIETEDTTTRFALGDVAATVYVDVRIVGATAAPGVAIDEPLPRPLAGETDRAVRA